MCKSANFASFRNMRLRITLHEPRHIQGEEMLRWAWLLRIILVVIWGARSKLRAGFGKSDGRAPSVRNDVSLPESVLVPGSTTDRTSLRGCFAVWPRPLAWRIFVDEIPPGYAQTSVDRLVLLRDAVSSRMLTLRWFLFFGVCVRFLLLHACCLFFSRRPSPPGLILFVSCYRI